MEHQLEIEVKSLLGDAEAAISFRSALKEYDPNLESLGKHSQLNHYFVGTATRELGAAVGKHLSVQRREELEHILEKGNSFSVRTRLADGHVFFIVKASIDDTTSENGTARIEFEEEIADLSLEELDRILLDSGMSYQAKWSREREEFRYKDMNVSLDRNAGYGYVAEFEKLIRNADEADATKASIRDAMREIGVEELSQDRLERMFAYYNEHWPEYYGTDKIFVVE